ncbi:hypothetical protein GF367_03605 [Candidatus Woesearchaeota archaeon]|nr:hypothetical protein [Candidatus Woesearchaeota archaeon]
MAVALLLAGCAGEPQGRQELPELFTCDDGNKVLDRSECGESQEPVRAVAPGGAEAGMTRVEETGRAVLDVGDAEDVFAEYAAGHDYVFESAERVVGNDGEEYYRVVYADNELDVKGLAYIDDAGNVYEQALIV